MWGHYLKTAEFLKHSATQDIRITYSIIETYLVLFSYSVTVWVTVVGTEIDLTV